MFLGLKIEFFDKIEQKMRDGDGDGGIVVVDDVIVEEKSIGLVAFPG